MKKLAVLLSILFFFTGCDDFERVITEKIEGTWVQTQTEYVNSVTFDYTTCNRQNTIEFFNNGKFESINFPHKEDFTNAALLCVGGNNIQITLSNGNWQRTAHDEFTVRFFVVVQGRETSVAYKLKVTDNTLTLFDDSDTNNPVRVTYVRR